MSLVDSLLLWGRPPGEPQSAEDLDAETVGDEVQRTSALDNGPDRQRDPLRLAVTRDCPWAAR